MRTTLLVLALVVGLTEPLGALDTVTRIDDEKVVGIVTGVDSSGVVTITPTMPGKPPVMRIPASEVLSVRFDVPLIANPAGDLLVLASGERYRISVRPELMSAQPGVVCSGADVLKETNSMAFANLRAYVPGGRGAGAKAEHAVVDELLSFENDRDVVAMANGDRLTGVVELLAPTQAVVSAKVGRVPVPRDLLVGIAFSKTLRPYTEPEGLLAETRLTDGSVVVGSIAGPIGGRYTLRSVLRYRWEVQAKTIREVRFRGGKLVWLSDLEPAKVEMTPFFNRSWPYRKNRSVWGKPLSVKGVVYERGLGVHSRTELTYDIGGEFATFIADIGIDDETRGEGSAVFSVRGDGATLLPQVEMSGGQKPRRVKVSVAGVRQLKLLVDFGKDQGVGDHGDWLNARLIRK